MRVPDARCLSSRNCVSVSQVGMMNNAQGKQLSSAHCLAQEMNQYTRQDTYPQGAEGRSSTDYSELNSAWCKVPARSGWVPGSTGPKKHNSAERNAFISTVSAIWKTQQCPQDWKRSVFIPIPKKGHAKECSNYCTIAFISHASKVMFKILQARLQQYLLNWELPDVQGAFRKSRGIRDQITICWITEKAREFQKNIYFCFIRTMLKPLTMWITANWKILEEMGIPDHLTCLLRNLYAGQEATVRTRHGTTDWIQIGKGVHQSWLLSPWLFNLYAEYIMQNARLDEAPAGIIISPAVKILITSDIQMIPL